MIDRCGIENDVIMDMGMIDMGGDNKLILALGKAHGQLIADLLCLLWGDLTWLEGLPDLIGNNISFRIPAGALQIFLLGQHKFFVHCLRITTIAADIFSFFGLISVLCIIGSVRKTLGNGFSFVDV